MLKLTAAQKRAGFFEFAVGVPLNIALFGALYFVWLPEFSGTDSAIGRVVLTLKCLGLPGATMLFGLWAVALGRGISKAIDPLAGAESKTLLIHIRYLQNTLEQLVLFAVAAISLSPFLSPATIKIVPAAAVLFFVNRLVFWAGYLKDPMLRGAGLSGTLYPISFMMLAALYYGVKYIALGH